MPEFLGRKVFGKLEMLEMQKCQKCFRAFLHFYISNISNFPKTSLPENSGISNISTFLQKKQKCQKCRNARKHFYISTFLTFLTSRKLFFPKIRAFLTFLHFYKKSRNVRNVRNQKETGEICQYSEREPYFILATIVTVFWVFFFDSKRGMGTKQKVNNLGHDRYSIFGQKFTFPRGVSLFVLSVFVVYSDRSKLKIRRFSAKFGVVRV